MTCLAAIFPYVCCFGSAIIGGLLGYTIGYRAGIDYQCRHRKG